MRLPTAAQDTSAARARCTALPCAPTASCSGRAACCRDARSFASVSSNGSAPAQVVAPASGAQRIQQSGENALGTSLLSKNLNTLTARDMMTHDPLTLLPDTPVMEAMNILVEKRISAVPVVDDSNKVLGMVSGYDLLALDSTPGHLDRSFFPPIDTCINEYGGDKKMMWTQFKELRKKLQVANGSTVAEVMHQAFAIRPDASMEEAASKVVRKRAHRMCVVDAAGKLLGIVSRGDIMRATVASFNHYMSSTDDEEEAAAARASSN